MTLQASMSINIRLLYTHRRNRAKLT